MAEVIALKCHDSDNVAVIFAENVKKGTVAQVRDKRGNVEHVTLLSDIPYGHKVAVREVHIGEPILKYGEEIGVATKEITLGDYVHVHNLDSQRGRGDLQ